MKQEKTSSKQTGQAAVKRGINKKLIAILVPAVAVILALAIALPIVLSAKPTESPFAVPENKLPIEEKYALNRYSFDELDDVQTTIRSDTENVTKRNLPRAEAQLLSNDFSLVYDTEAKTLTPVYDMVQPTTKLKVASITFNENNYPSPGKASTQAGYADAATAAGVSTATYYSYYKYMLMTQGQNLAVEAARRSAATASDSPEPNAEFVAWLKKHPAADAQYGAVLGENNAVEKQIVLDPLYRSPHVSGLYLPAGEPVTVKVEGLAPGEKIGITLGMQNSLAWRGGVPSNGLNLINAETGGINQVTFANNASDAFFKQADLVTALGGFYDCNSESSTPFLQSQWARNNNRAPWITADFTFTENKTYTVGTAFGGAIHINMGNCYSKVKVTISGAVETPHYILGTTTPEYFDQYLRQAPGVIAILDTENGQLIGPTGEMGTTRYMRQVKTDEIEKLAMLWHSFLSVDESFTGGTYNRFNKVMFDQHVPAGAAVALGNYSFAHPTGWFDGAMNYRGLLSSGTWGILHEIGHNHATSYGTVWGFGTGREGEVRNNALTLLSYILFCDIGTTIRSGGSAEHGAYANPYSVLNETLKFKGRTGDFDDGFYGYFQCLGMYSNIMHSFGAEKYYELLYTYKSVSSYCANKRADFAYRCSLIYGMNFINYFNTFYCANITDAMFNEQQLEEMTALPNYEPVANFYAGAIDGVKTAGDYCVAFGDDLTFDLLSTTISSLDTADGKGFEIISVEQPAHGKITGLGDGKWRYSFNKSYAGAFDEFSFSVKLSDGIVHRFTVTLRISYNGARVSTYSHLTVSSGSAEQRLDEVLTQTQELTPVITSVSNPAISYNSGSGNNEVKVVEYYYKAPESGTYEIALRGDDYAYAYFGDGFGNLQKVMTLPRYSAGYSENLKYSVTLEKDKFYAVRLYNLNTGGSGGVALGIRKEGEASFSNIPADCVFHPDYPIGQTAEKFVFEPKYLVSKKDNVKLSTTGTDKSEWVVVKAPENIVGGRIETQQLIDPETGIPIEGGVFEFDKWTYLIDGQTGTSIHTTYGGNVPKITPESPHEFIVDTTKIQQFNYVSVSTRNHNNSYMTDFEVQISNSLDGGWQTVGTGDRETYTGTTATVNFTQVEGRYIRVLVKGTTGGTFSVLAEIDAGIKSTTQRIVASTSSKLYTTKGWVNSSTLESEPNGYIIAQKKNSKAVIKFRGESFAIYAATGEGYGVADVRVDGKYAGRMDLNSKTEESRKLAFYIENLKDKEHTVEIITKTSGKVMVNVLGIPYTAEILNASNIYLERGLAISLTVFVVLFAALLAFALVLLFVPKFRQKVFGNKVVEKLDAYMASDKKSKKARKENGAATKNVKPAESVKSAEKATTVSKAESAPAAKKTAETKTEAAKAPAAKKTATVKAVNKKSDK